MAKPMSPQLICETTGGVWNECASACGIANCENPSPEPDLICIEVCVESCICPASSPLWEPAQGGCIAEEECDGGTTGSTSGDETDGAGEAGEAPPVVECTNEHGDCTVSGNWHSCFCYEGSATGGESGDEIWVGEDELQEWCDEYLEDMCGTGASTSEGGDTTSGG